MSTLFAALLIFSFQFSLLFLPYIGRQAAPSLRRTIGIDTQYRTSDVAENLDRHLSCAERKSQGIDFKLILTVTRRAAVYLGTHCNTNLKRAFPTSVFDR